MLKLIKLVLFLIFCSRRSRSPGSGGGGGSNNLLIYSRIILYCSCKLNCGNTHFKCRYDHRICHSRVKMSSTNWAAPNIRVLIANLIEHCRANAETMGSNPAEDPKFFIGLIYNCIFVYSVDVCPNRLPLLHPFIC